MGNFKISVVDKVPDDITMKMDAGLDEYAFNHGIDISYKPICFILYNEENEAIGVLDAFSSYLSVHIRDIWVAEAFRGKGYGKRLIMELEERFRGKGFYNINLVTCAFQAPEFYKKCGYKVEFIRENIKNPKLTLTFFIKYLYD